MCIRDSHKVARKFIFDEIVSHNNAQRKTVVITHHLPCRLSVPEEYRRNDDPFNFAYYSDLSNQIFDTEPTLWIHGHTHSNCDYYLGNTRVICNPRGYVGHELNKGFDPYLTIELPKQYWPDDDETPTS